MSDDSARAEAEIVELHEFFEGWLAGTLSSDDEIYQTRFADHLGEGFVMVQPGGMLTPRAELVSGLRGAHAANPEFRIAITDVTVQLRSGDILVVTYTEWQKNAKASKPANNGRRSTVIFRDDGGKLIWAHLHETWLPADEMTAGNYDF